MIKDMLKKNNKDGKKIFISSSGVITSFTFYIPSDISDVLKSIQSDIIFKANEFSIFVKGDIDWKNRHIDIKKDWFFPKQTISASGVDYHEDDVNFNGIIHKHPGYIARFSKTDDEYINQNFEFSMIWLVDRWGDAIINIPSPAGRLQLPMYLLGDAEDFDPIKEVIKIAKNKVFIKKFPRQNWPYVTQKGSKSHPAGFLRTGRENSAVLVEGEKNTLADNSLTEEDLEILGPDFAVGFDFE